MNNTAELINEQEAAKMARVSASTLARFAEAGYFQVETRGQDRLYSKRALASVFGVTFSDPSSHKENVIPFPQQGAQMSEAAKSDESAHPVSAATSTPHPEIVENRPEAEPVDPIWGTPVQTDRTSQKNSLGEDAHFQQIMEMHADILSRQEREIEGLKTEREWLRRRIEKLEEKAERDQVLLLSEAQTVKQLIQLQSQKKSTMRLALEWFGIVPESRNAVNSLDYQGAPLHRGPADSSVSGAVETSASQPRTGKGSAS